MDPDPRGVWTREDLCFTDLRTEERWGSLGPTTCFYAAGVARFGLVLFGSDTRNSIGIGEGVGELAAEKDGLWRR